jgi:hypothetical protein
MKTIQNQIAAKTAPTMISALPSPRVRGRLQSPATSAAAPPRESETPAVVLSASSLKVVLRGERMMRAHLIAQGIVAGVQGLLVWLVCKQTSEKVRPTPAGCRLCSSGCWRSL